MTQYVRASTDSSQSLLNTASLEIEHCHDEYILGLYEVQNYLVSSRANWQAGDLIGSFHPAPTSCYQTYFSAHERNAAGNETRLERSPLLRMRGATRKRSRPDWESIQSN